MNFLELAKTRYSVRSYDQRPVEEEKLAQILEAGRVAPSACNKQPQKIFVVKSAKARETLASVCSCTFDAPVILVVCYDRTLDWKNPLSPGYESGETDAAIVTTHMMLEAAALGVGSCWVGYFAPDRIKAALDLPENLVVSALLPLGYPAADCTPASMHSSFREYNETICEL